MVKYRAQSFRVAGYCVRKQVEASSDGSGSGEHQDDERLIRMNPISPEILGDTWRSLESLEGLAPDMTQPTQGVIGVEPIWIPQRRLPLIFPWMARIPCR